MPSWHILPFCAIFASCNGKIRRCHIAFAAEQLLYLCAARRNGGASAVRVPGGRTVRQKEVLHGHCAQPALPEARGL